MKIQYFIPIIGYLLMGKKEQQWRKNTPEHEYGFRLFEAYHFASVMIFNILIVKFLFL